MEINQLPAKTNATPELLKTQPEGEPYSIQILSGIKKELVELSIRFSISRIIRKHIHKRERLKHILKLLEEHRQEMHGNHRIRKIAKAGNRYYWDLFVPGWGSPAFAPFFEAEANRITPIQIRTNRLSNIFLALTKKCPMQCEHCFEWDVLNKREKLTYTNLLEIVTKFQQLGVGQIFLTGGEPMMRVNDIIKLLKSSSHVTDFWMITSGYQLTKTHATNLQTAGLTGVIISLDHFNQEEHNRFRGYTNAYAYARLAARNSIAAGMVTALSICVTNAFISLSNLKAYMDLAKKWGVAFVQFQEPKALGHYAGKDVKLTAENKKILEDFFLEMNSHPDYKDYPIISYDSYFQRKSGCYAAGNRSLHVDTDGDLHSCPFCQLKSGKAMSDELEVLVDNLQQKGCPRKISVQGR